MKLSLRLPARWALLLFLCASGSVMPHRVGAQGATNLPPYWQWQNPLPQGFDLADLHVFNDSTAVAVGQVGTVVKTADYGRTWRVGTANTTDNLTAVSFSSSLVGWVGGSSQSTTVRKTVDGGLTWTVQSLGIAQASLIRDIQFFNSLEGYVLYYKSFSGTTGLSYTADGGQTWTVKNFLVTGDPETMQFVSPLVGYALGGFPGYRCIKTIDGGMTWQNALPNPSLQGKSISFVNPDYGWIATTNGIYRTRNGGQTWQTQQLPGAVGRVVFADSLHGISYGQALYSTSDGGRTWAFSSYPAAYFPTDMHLQPSGAGWLVGQRGEWWRTIDYGANWLRADSIPAGTASQAQFSDPTHGWVIKSRTKMASTTDRGATWGTVDLRTKTPSNTANSVDWGYGAGNIQAMHFVDRDTGFVAVMDYGDSNVGGSTPRLFSLATQNGGQTWALTQQPALNITGAQTPFPLVRDMRFHSSRRGLLVGARGLIRRTADGGQTWTTPVVPAFVNQRRLLSQVEWTDAQTVYVMGDSLTILKSTDGGATFQPMTGLAAFNAALAQPRRWDFYGRNIAFVTPLLWLATSGSEVVRTTDGGQTWAFATLPPPLNQLGGQSISRFSFCNALEGWAFAGNSLLATTDGGQTWARTTIFYSFGAGSEGVRIDRYNGWSASGAGNLIHYSEKFLTTASLAQTTHCTGDILNVAFAREGTFGTNEQAVRVELSNARGRFRPGETRLLGQGAASPIQVAVPAGLTAGGLYRVRVIRADSSVLGGDNGQDLRLIMTPLAPQLATLAGQVLQATLPTASPVPTRYEWEVGGVSVAGATGAQLTPRTSGAYRVRACSATCCGPWSAPSAVVLATVAPTAQELRLYPNPARTTLWLERPAGAAGATVQLLDVTGRVVWHGTAGGGSYALPVQQVPAGLYLVRLQTPTGLPQVVRVVVEH